MLWMTCIKRCLLLSIIEGGFNGSFSICLCTLYLSNWYALHQYEDQLISPKQFVHISGKATLKDWKRAIRMGGVMLR